MPAVAGFPLDRFCLSNKVLTLIRLGSPGRLTGSSVKGSLWPSGTILYGSLLNPLRSTTWPEEQGPSERQIPFWVTRPSGGTLA